jgi:DNA invertase Pin-like site-specific DNA recombinase
MTVAVYVRVSTRRQKDDSQRAEIERWLTANSIDSTQVTWYSDQESGTTLKRPAFERLQRDVFDGKVKCIVLWKLDRLSRRLRDGVNILADWADRGLKVVVTSQQLEFHGSVGRMIAALLLGLAEIEWEFRKERQQAGIAVAKKHGIYKGRVKGTTKSKPDRAVELKDKGLTAAEISTALGVSERTVFRYLNATSNSKSTT